MGVAFNALPGDELQSDFKDWASVRYRQAWDELSKKRRRRTELGQCLYKLDRVVEV